MPSSLSGSRLEALYLSTFSFKPLHNKAPIGDPPLRIELNKLETKATICFPGTQIIVSSEFTPKPQWFIPPPKYHFEP